MKFSVKSLIGAGAVTGMLGVCVLAFFINASDNKPYSEQYDIHGQVGEYQYALKLSNDAHMGPLIPTLLIKNSNGGEEFPFILDLPYARIKIPHIKSKIEGTWAEWNQIKDFDLRYDLGDSIPLIDVVTALCEQSPNLLDERRSKEPSESSESIHELVRAANDEKILKSLKNSFCPGIR